jgi:chemotaxis response regulator CheB
MQKAKRTCIIIDDEVPSHKMLEYHIAAHPELKLVARCFDAFEGIQAIQARKPDIVFLDMGMPQMTGLEMLAQIPDADIQVVIVTASLIKESDLTDPRIKGMVFKPATAARFSEMLRRVI